MLLRNPDGTFFRMKIIGYAEPRARAYVRANALRLQLSARTAQGGWQTDCIGLTTYEAGWLADWLEQVAGGTETRLRLDFLEPCLSFMVLDTPKGRKVRLFFEAQARPGWLMPACRGLHDLWLDFPLQELSQATAALRQEAARFPERSIPAAQGSFLRA